MTGDFDFFAPRGLTAALGLTREGERMDTEVKRALLGLIGDARHLVAKACLAVDDVRGVIAKVRHVVGEAGEIVHDGGILMADTYNSVGERMNRIEGYVQDALRASVKRDT